MVPMVHRNILYSVDLKICDSKRWFGTKIQNGRFQKSQDFGLVLGAFWVAKASIFAFFSMFFRCKIWIATWKGKQSLKNANKRPRIRFSAVRAAMGGRIIGWGEACLGVNFKPYLKQGLRLSF